MKYPGLSPGHPLDMLGEEATEVAKEIFKSHRFGLNSETSRAAGWAGPSTREALIQEVGDFLFALDLCVKLGYMTTDEIESAKVIKETRMIELFGPLFASRMASFKR